MTVTSHWESVVLSGFFPWCHSILVIFKHVDENIYFLAASVLSHLSCYFSNCPINGQCCDLMVPEGQRRETRDTPDWWHGKGTEPTSTLLAGQGQRQTSENIGLFAITFSPRSLFFCMLLLVNSWNIPHYQFQEVTVMNGCRPLWLGLLYVLWSPFLKEF